MNKPDRYPSSRAESHAEYARVDEAVRRATPLRRVIFPSRMALLRTLGLYANIFVLVVALGVPNGTIRRVADDAISAFDGIARQAADSLVPEGVIIVPPEFDRGAMATDVADPAISESKPESVGQADMPVCVRPEATSLDDAPSPANPEPDDGDSGCEAS